MDGNLKYEKYSGRFLSKKLQLLYIIVMELGFLFYSFVECFQILSATSKSINMY